MANNPIFVDLPRRDATLVLPQLRELVLATLAAEGYGERAEYPIRYQPTVDEREGITIKILPPLAGVIQAEWVRESGVNRLQFELVEMMVSMTPTGMPFGSPPAIVPPFTVFRIGFEPPPSAPLAEPAPAVIMPRERAISLDDW
jgi:hypothetical protein